MFSTGPQRQLDGGLIKLIRPRASLCMAATSARPRYLRKVAAQHQSQRRKAFGQSSRLSSPSSM